MKNYKTIMPVVLLGFLILSCVYLVKDAAQRSGEYNALLTSARQKLSEGLTSEAAARYEEALAIYPTPELYLEVGQMYLDMGETEIAMDWTEEQVLQRYPKDERGYEFMMQCYEKEENIASMFSTYNTAKKRGLKMDVLDEIIQPYWYAYRLGGRYTTVGEITPSGNRVAISTDEAWGYITPTGTSAVQQAYSSANAFINGMAAVKDQSGKWWYIDQSGQKAVSQESFEDAVSEFKSCGDDMLLACADGVWNYYDLSSKDKLFGGYKEATPMVNGVAAVSTDGKKWGLISKDGTELTAQEFDAVITDGNGILCNANALFIKQNDRYYLVDTKGSKISQTGYTDAKNFTAAGSYAAVEKDGKWTFVDEQGNELKLEGYQDAQSFCSGLAAVKTARGWNYIDAEGTVVIQADFDAAGPFSAYGTAFVKENSEEDWTLLTLYRTQSS